MTKWLFQKSTIKSDEIEKELLSNNFNFLEFTNIPFTQKIIDLENILTDSHEDYIIRGGTKILSLFNNITSLKELDDNITTRLNEQSELFIHKLKSGLFYNEHNFDQANYLKLGLPLLNQDAKLISIKDNMNLSLSNDYFIKPSKDQKSFNAGILWSGQTIGEFIQGQLFNPNFILEQAIIASCKKVEAEYRFFVVNQEIITGSLYHLNHQLKLDSYIPDYVISKAKEYAQLYQPHDIFTMDLAVNGSYISIVEYNCWNTSGMYKSDILKIFTAVDNYVKNKPRQKLKI